MKIERSLVAVDPLLYEIMYFSPVEVGDERSTNQLYFQTERYNRTWPTSMINKMSAQIDQLRHVELGIHPFDKGFKHKHRETVLSHCKMALAYLDSREARIAMKVCEVADAATKSTENRIVMDPEVDFDFLRITTLSVMACAARRVKFYQKAVDALAEAKDICLAESETNHVHPLMTALTLLNLSAVLGDIDHDEHGLRWGLEALNLMYQVFSSNPLDETIQAYYLALACHNAALLNVKLARWDDAVELVDEGLEFTKLLHEQDDGLRKKLIAIGAQAKHVPERFLFEAANAMNGWGEERGVWNTSFWDFTPSEIKEQIRVLQNTKTLTHLIIDHFNDEDPAHGDRIDDHLARVILAIVSCQSLEKLTVGHIDFDPRKVWLIIKKRSFLETSWYASALNFANILQEAQKPEIASYAEMLKNLKHFLRKLSIFLVVLANQCEGIDLSNNGINRRTISALVKALRWPQRLTTSRPVSHLVLRNNAIDAECCRELARTWSLGLVETTSVYTCSAAEAAKLDLVENAEPPVDKNVASLDVSYNLEIGDKGFDFLVGGVHHFDAFRTLQAESIGLTMKGCSCLSMLASTRLELLCLSKNLICSEGATIVCDAALKCKALHTLELNECGIDADACQAIADLLQEHQTLRKIFLSDNCIGNDGAIRFCAGAAASPSLALVHLARNSIVADRAAEAIGDMMRNCETLTELNLSGNKLDPAGAPAIGNAIEHSRVLTMFLEDMGFTDSTIDDFLDHGAAETQDLQVMRLSGNPVGDEGLSVIAECLSIGLTDLSLKKCGLTHNSQATLLDLVSLSPNLRSLDLSENDLGPYGCADMVSWMTQNVKENFSLRSLELGSCDIGDEGFQQLVPVLGSLSYVGLRNNGITSAGLAAVMNTTYMIQLKVLDLAENSIGEQGVHALTERFQQEHKRSLWNPKQLTSTIDQVILSNNAISDGLAKSTEAFLKIHNPLLTVVW
eukprot:TRINITY_DN35595_c0_g1_i4.p1 TRINITY_DN35595_c0_g1~~TRINITY_DN35595_c0_g1_i4.p1  ORF type:complete len:966 (+),score=219.68 TRINITY_DN35595_c0_g1_i4:114-3011(+)